MVFSLPVIFLVLFVNGDKPLKNVNDVGNE